MSATFRFQMHYCFRRSQRNMMHFIYTHTLSLSQVAFCQFSSIQLSVMSDSLRPHESQHTRPPCPSPTPGVYSNSCPSSQWCHPAISSSVIPFSSCPQSLPASGSFPMSHYILSKEERLWNLEKVTSQSAILVRRMCWQQGGGDSEDSTPLPS